MPPSSQVTGGSTVFGVGKCPLEAIVRGLAPSMLHEEIHQSPGLCLLGLGEVGGRFSFMERALIGITFFSSFLRPHSQHMEVPRLGVKLEL